MTADAPGPADVFDTAELRRVVLDAWAAAPSRFREDANAEEDLVRGGYRDRVIVELVQNAADAAAAVGSRGRVLLELAGDRLTVANTGVPVDRNAVASLSSLRASTKRDGGGVGRFGVGFAAVLAVTDEPALLTGRGAVGWSRRRSRDIAATLPALADELQRRGNAVPVLRLPFPVETGDRPPPGYDTAVVLPLRDAAAVDLVRDLLDGVDDAVMLAFGDVADITIIVDGNERNLLAQPPRPFAGGGAAARGGADRISAHPAADDGDADGRTDLRVVAVNERRWAVGTRTGTAEPEVLADRPSEERLRRRWDVRVAVLLDGDGRPTSPLAVDTGRPAAVVHAPTPTDDRTDLPALVIGSFPVDSSRRRIAPGPLTDHLVDQMGRAYADLLAGLAVPEALDLVPLPLGAGDLDTALHRAVLDALAGLPWIPAAPPDAGRLRPRETVLIDGLDGDAAAGDLAGIVVGLPDRQWWRPDVLRRLGATVRPLADVIDDLAGLRLEPSVWRRIYDSLAGVAIPADLGALPVPLADGRLVRGPRGVMLPGDVAAPTLLALGLRVADPAAAHPLLRRLGAVDATPNAVLHDPAVRAAVEHVDPDQPAAAAELGDAVLDLVAVAGADPAVQQWLSTVPVRTRAGDLAPIGELWLPDAPVAGLLDLDPDADLVAESVVDRHGRDVLAAAGAAPGFRVVSDDGVILDTDTWHDLDAEEDYVAFVVDLLPGHDTPPVIAEFTAVADLDLVRPDAWPYALRVLATDPATRSALVESAVVDLAGVRHTVPSYTAWWLRAHATIGGTPVSRMRAADVDDPVVAAVFPPAPVALDERVARALGIIRTLEDTTPSVVVERLAADDVELSAAELASIYSWLADADPDDVEPPDRIRVPDGAGSTLVEADQVVLAEAPHWLPVLAGRAVLAGPPGLADVLDIASASEEIPVVVPPGVVAAVPDVVSTVLPDAPSTYIEHDDLVVGGVDVAWWADEDGTVHAATADGLAAGLAWTAGRWDRRWLLAAALADPASVDELLAQDVFR